MHKLRQKKDDPQGQISLFHEMNCERAFKLVLGRDPYAMYALNTSLESSGIKGICGKICHASWNRPKKRV